MQTITLYKDNNIANVKVIEYEEVYQGLISYDMFVKSYPQKINFANCLILFLSNDDGLSSTFDSELFEPLKNYCFHRHKNNNL